MSDGADADDRRSWPYFSAPLWAYLAVMIPICVLEAFLLAARSPAWIRWSAGVVVVMSGYGLVRGYVCRLVLSEKAARLSRLTGEIEIEWSRVRRVGVYVPGGGVGSARYVYITTRDKEPGGKWDVGPDVIQLQDRTGLLEAIRQAQSDASGSKSHTQQHDVQRIQ